MIVLIIILGIVFGVPILLLTIAATLTFIYFILEGTAWMWADILGIAWTSKTFGPTRKAEQ